MLLCNQRFTTLFHLEFIKYHELTQYQSKVLSYLKIVEISFKLTHYQTVMRFKFIVRNDLI